MKTNLTCGSCGSASTEAHKDVAGRLELVCFGCHESLGVWEPKGFKPPRSITLKYGDAKEQTIVLAHITALRREAIAVVIDVVSNSYRFEYVTEEQAARQLEELQVLVE